MMLCHHDDLVIEDSELELLDSFLDNPDTQSELYVNATERQQRIMLAYVKWVTTVRSTGQLPSYPANWKPTYADICKSRLFWWIRSGHEPLTYEPPCAYSCPWYELIVEEGWHSVYEIHIFDEDHWLGKCALVCQAKYKILEKINDEEYYLGFGPYVFHAKRRYEKWCKDLEDRNKHRTGVFEEYMARKDVDISNGYYLMRIKEKEDL